MQFKNLTCFFGLVKGETERRKAGWKPELNKSPNMSLSCKGSSVYAHVEVKRWPFYQSTNTAVFFSSSRYSFSFYKIIIEYSDFKCCVSFRGIAKWVPVIHTHMSTLSRIFSHMAIVVVHSLSCVQPLWTHGLQHLPALSSTVSWSLLRFVSDELVMLAGCLTLCYLISTLFWYNYDVSVSSVGQQTEKLLLNGNTIWDLIEDPVLT